MFFGSNFTVWYLDASAVVNRKLHGINLVRGSMTMFMGIMLSFVR